MEKGLRFNLDTTDCSTLKEERNCFKDVDQNGLGLNKLAENKLSAIQFLRCIWQLNLQMLVSSRTKEIIMFSAQLKESARPLTLKAPHHMLHYSAVMSPSDGAHQSTSFQLDEALMNFTASIQSKKNWEKKDFLHKQTSGLIVCFGNQATRWFLFVRQATLWHSELKSYSHLLSAS